ncbi:hypothetical protein A4X13_0g6283 [Tilletia indica]|uniref:Uncharacterized protein n=1 Tax=Tilletia indica TaxID=43049 RepID=A0A177TGT3_9BASI|nr:hypothetical protein A4X13_0g6283 [Tilletia indica]
MRSTCITTGNSTGGGGGGGSGAGGVNGRNWNAGGGAYRRDQEYSESAMFDMSEDEAEGEAATGTQHEESGAGVELAYPVQQHRHRRVSDIRPQQQQQRNWAAQDSPSSSVAASPSRLPQQAARPQPRMRASWLTDSFVLSRRQSIAESLNRSSISGSHRSDYHDHHHDHDDDQGYNRPAPLVEIFQKGERLGPGLVHDGHPIQIAHTSEGFRAQDNDDSGSQLEIVRKLGEGSYAVVYLVREIIPGPSPVGEYSIQQSSSQQLDDLDQYSRTLRASDQPHTNPDSPWSSPHPALRSSPAAKPTGRKFALKCLCKRHLDDVHLEIQRLEATIHQSIGFHPNIVTLYRVYETPDWLFLVLEYCPGQDLYFWLERSQDLAGGLTPAGSIYRGDISSELSSPSRGLSPKPLPSLRSNEPWDLDEDFENTPPNPSLLGSTSNLSLLSRRRLRLVSRMFRQMCDAVQFCHDQGISHRDLKPENFIVEDRRWFFDWEEEEDAYENDETSQYGAVGRAVDDKIKADPHLSVNLLAATPTAASIFDQSKRFRASDGPNRPSPSRSASSWNRGGQASREGKVVVKLTDFGLATADEQCRDFDCGSQPYMAFECANDNAPYYDAKQADIWSLGVCLLNLIFHRSPFKEPNAQRCESFASFCYDPVKFLTEAFEGLTRDAAEYLAKNVFCEISDKYPGRTRISAKAFADWAEHLPEHMGLASTDASRILTRGPDHSITSPLSHSRAGSVSSYLPFSFDSLSIHETVPVETLPEHLLNVELPEELGDSTYIHPGDTTSMPRDESSLSSRTASDADATLGASASLRSESSPDDNSARQSGSNAHGDAEDRESRSLDEDGDAGEATGDSEHKAQGGKPRRRKRGARKGRVATKANETVLRTERVVEGPVTSPMPAASSQRKPASSDLDRVINQLAAASQQLARDISKMKTGASSGMYSSSSGQATVVPPTPLDGSATKGGALIQSTTGLNTFAKNGVLRQPNIPNLATHLSPAPLSIITDNRFDNKSSLRLKHNSSSPPLEHEPMEVMMHASSVDRTSQPWRPLNPGLTKPTSWRERSSNSHSNNGTSSTSSSSNNTTFGTVSDTASTHSTASAPAGLPGPRHRPADLKMGDKAVDVSYLAAVFNGVKEKMGSSHLLGMGRKTHHVNGGPGQAGQGHGHGHGHGHGRPTAQTASAPARHIQMPSSILHSAVGGVPASMAMPMPVSNSSVLSNGHLKNGNDLAGARPQWRDQTAPSHVQHQQQQQQHQPQQQQHQQLPQSSPHQQYHLHNNYHQQNHHRNGPDSLQQPPMHHHIQQKGAATSLWAPPLPGSLTGSRENGVISLGAVANGHHHHHGAVRNDHHRAVAGGSAAASLNADAAKTWRRN